MARETRRHITILAAAALLLIAATPGLTQSASAATGALWGKLTDLRAAPLAGVEVILRNTATGAELRTTTAKNGAYRIQSLDAGEYTLEADSPHLGRGQLDGIVIAAGHESRILTAIQLTAPALAIAAPAPMLASAPIERPAPPPTEAAPIAHLDNSKANPPPSPALRPAPQSPAPAVASTTLPDQSIAPVPAQSLAQPLAAVNPKPLPAPKLPPVQPSIASAAASAAAPVAPANMAPAPLTQPILRATAPKILPIVAAAERPGPAAPAVTTILIGDEIESLPASGRRWQNLFLDTPASASASGSSQSVLRGAATLQPDTTIDGLTTRLAFGAAALAEPRTQDSGPSSGSNSGQAMGQSSLASRGFSISEAAIREVQTVAGNVEAEGARAAGGRIDIETARGENALHGQAFLFDRQNNWGARNPFTQWVRNTGTASAPVFTPTPFTPPDHETAFGAGLGGRIRRDKPGGSGGLFWFAALDGNRRNDPGLSMVKNPSEFFFVPTSNDAQIATLAAQLGESETQAFNDYLGNSTSSAGAGLEQLAALLGPAPRTSAQWVGFARLDWQAAERHRVTLEGGGADWNSPGGGLSRVSETYGSHSYGSSNASQQWLLARWTAYLTPNLLATTQASAGRDIFSARPDAPSALEQSLLAGNAWNQLPQIVVDSRYGFTIGNPARFGQGSYPDEHLYHAQEAIDWVRGSLLLRAGFEVDHNNDATTLLRNQTGTYYYAKIENFISDALSFERFGLSDALDPFNPHNCTVTGSGFGASPCYSYYSQVIGPTNWRLSTTDWAGYATAQWQPGKLAVFSAGLRWDREALPPPLSALSNPGLPLTQKLPSPGSEWGPRLSLALGNSEGRWPVLRLGYGLYYGRTENATLETALTQTGSLKGDLNFFLRPSDDCQFCSGGAPPFPYVFTGSPASVVKPGAVEFAPGFRNPEVHQGVASVEETLPGHVEVTAAALGSLGRRLPVSVDTNFNSAVNPQTITYAVVDGTRQGPIKSAQITVPFYASWPSPTGVTGRLNSDYQQITQVMARANSTYEAAMVRITRYGRGLTLNAHYTYAHAMDWNPNESTLVAGSDVLDPADFALEYGTSNLDVRHSAAATIVYETPWKRHGLAGRFVNGWMLSGIAQFRSGLPYTMRTSGSLAQEVTDTGAVIAALAPGINGSGGDNRVYGLGSDGRSYNIGRNTFRYPATWKADLRLGKRFDLGRLRSLELLAESFNLFNHQNVTEIETTGYYLEPGSATSLPTLNFLTGLKANTTAFGQPLNINATDFYRERQIQLGARFRF
jgi:hypothetical protein